MQWQTIWQKFKASFRANFWAYLNLFAQEDDFVHSHQRNRKASSKKTDE